MIPNPLGVAIKVFTFPNRREPEDQGAMSLPDVSRQRQSVRFGTPLAGPRDGSILVIVVVMTALASMVIYWSMHVGDEVRSFSEFYRRPGPELVYSIRQQVNCPATLAVQPACAAGKKVTLHNISGKSPPLLSAAYKDRSGKSWNVSATCVKNNEFKIQMSHKNAKVINLGIIKC